MDAAAIKAEVAQAYQRYLAAFNAGDLAAINAVIQYPLAHIGEGKVQMTERFPYNPAELKRTKQWHTTIDADTEVVAVSATKAHVVLRTAKRIRRDGSLIETVSAFYAFAKTDQGWKIFAISALTVPA
jgi:ketosteroid isomerase-like protein